MIIDAHTHIHPDPKGFGEKYDASVEHLITSLDNSEVDKVIVLPIYPLISNKFVADACKKYSDKNLKTEKLYILQNLGRYKGE